MMTPAPAGVSVCAEAASTASNAKPAVANAEALLRPKQGSMPSTSSGETRSQTDFEGETIMIPPQRGLRDRAVRCSVERSSRLLRPLDALRYIEPVPQHDLTYSRIVQHLLVNPLVIPDPREGFSCRRLTDKRRHRLVLQVAHEKV